MKNSDSDVHIENIVIITEKDVTANLYINDDYSLIITDNIFETISNFFIINDKAQYKLFIKNRKSNVTDEVLTAAAGMFLNEFTRSSFANGLFTQHIRLHTFPYVLEHKIFEDKCDDEMIRATVFFCIKILAEICKGRKPPTMKEHMRCSLKTDKGCCFRAYINENDLKSFCSQKNYIDFNMINYGVYMTTDFIGKNNSGVLYLSWH